jgi:predicted nucleic acid-binding protein
VKLRVYIDTSVVSAYVDDRLPERRRSTVEFWSRLAEYEVAISELTKAEIEATGDRELRAEMARLAQPFSVLVIDEEARRLAHEYVRRGVFSPGTIEDALHVAVAVVSRQEMVVRRSIS